MKLTSTGVRCLLLGLCLLLIATSAGCWSRRELESTAFVLGFGIDNIANGNVSLTVQTAIPGKLAGGGGSSGGGGGGGGDTGPVWVGSADGPTVFDAVRSLNARTSDSLFWAHARAFIISEAVARQGVTPILNFLNRQPQIRPSVYVLVTPDSPKDILKLTPPQEKIPIFYLTGLLGHANLQGRTVPIDLQDFRSSLADYGREPMTPVVRIYQEPKPKPKPPAPGTPKAAEASPADKGEKGSGGSSGGGGDQGGKPSEEEKPSQFALEGMAVFRRDRLVGWLSPAETTGVRWIRGEMSATPLTVKFPNPNQHVAVEIVRGKSEIGVEPDLANPGRSRFSVKITGEGNIQDVASFKGAPAYVDPEKLNAALSREVSKQVRGTIRKVQKQYSADIFGFGQRYRQSVPASVWRKVGPHWSQYFKDVPVSVEVKLAVRRRGMLLSP